MAPRILVVEDNEDLARALRRYLTRAGYDVVQASTCAAARQVTGVFDVAVLDVELSDGYGFDLWNDLVGKGIVGTVIFFTGTVNPQLLSRAEALAPCISKCEGIETLLEALKTAIANPPRQAAGSENDTPVPSTPRNRKG